MQKSVGKIFKQLGVFAPKIMRIEVDVFSDDHDEGKKDVDELHVFEVDLLDIEELVLVDTA